MRGHATWRWLGWSASLLLLWILTVSPVSTAELVTGALAAAVCALAATVARPLLDVSVRPGPPDPHRAASLVLAVAGGSLRLLALAAAMVLGRREPAAGWFELIPGGTGPSSTPAWVSASPTSVVVGPVDPAAQEGPLLVHAMPPDPRGLQRSAGPGARVLARPDAGPLSDQAPRPDQERR